MEDTTQTFDQEELEYTLEQQVADLTAKIETQEKMLQSAFASKRTVEANFEKYRKHAEEKLGFALVGVEQLYRGMKLIGKGDL